MDAVSATTAIVGESAMLRQAVSQAARLAKTGLPILLVGATGTGKDLFAQEIHRWSGRSGRLVDVNCGALPQDVAEGLLFGHRRGAFTGAVENTLGLIEASDGGTLFLDELASMPVEAQSKLLRVLENGEVRRVGETAKRKIRLRVVAALQEDTAERVAKGSLRFDLLQRLAGALIELPALAAREKDVLLLANHFARSHGRTLGLGTEPVLMAHNWPGNVRELQLAVIRAAELCDESVIPARVLAESINLGLSLLAPPVPLHPGSGTRMSTRERLIAVCAAHDWHGLRTAQALGLGRTTLFKQLKAYGVSLREERSSINNRVLGIRPA